jgi:hypothetical protein
MQRYENPLPEHSAELARITTELSTASPREWKLLSMNEEGVRAQMGEAAVQERAELISRQDALRARAAQLDQEITQARVALEPEGEKLMAELRGGLLRRGEDAAEGMAGRVEFEPSAEKALEARGRTTDQARREIGEFYRITGGQGPDPEATSWEATRSRADTEPGRLDLGGGTAKKTIFHEMAHHLEFQDPELAGASRSFRDARAANAGHAGKEYPLQQLEPEGNYRPDEMVMIGNFKRLYTGKTYKDGITEVVTMGLQEFTNPRDMFNLWRVDPEHFLLTLGAIRGRS